LKKEENMNLCKNDEEKNTLINNEFKLLKDKDNINLEEGEIKY